MAYDTGRYVRTEENLADFSLERDRDIDGDGTAVHCAIAGEARFFQPLYGVVLIGAIVYEIDGNIHPLVEQWRGGIGNGYLVVAVEYSCLVHDYQLTTLGKHRRAPEEEPPDHQQESPAMLH